MVDLGGRTRGRRQPNDEPAAADPDGRGARLRRRPPPQQRPLGARVSLLRDRRRAGGRVPDRVSLRVQLGHHRERSHHPSPAARPHPELVCGHPDRRAGVARGDAVGRRRRAAAGTMLCCIGAANALANPKRALRVLPGALYELGTAVAVVDQPRPAAGRERPAGGRARDGCEADAGAAGGPCNHRDPGSGRRAGALADARRSHGLPRLRPDRPIHRAPAGGRRQR